MLLEEKRYAAAIQQLEAAVKLDPGSIPIRLSLAQALAADGRVEEGLSQCLKAREIAPGDPAIRQTFEQIRRQAEPAPSNPRTRSRLGRQGSRFCPCVAQLQWKAFRS